MITIKNLTKKYDDKTVYYNFNLNIKKGKITAILGESGSGKTTLLNILAGLTDYEGIVEGIKLPVAMVFQRDRLVKNLTVEENIKLVNSAADVKSELEKIGLGGCEKMYPKQLSAGMARRVAILRAFAFESDAVLMDEPFVNLDVALKFYLVEEVKKSCREKNKTAVVVTHDIKEAVTLADEIIVLSRGEIIYRTDDVLDKTEEELFSLMKSMPISR